jgi:hypothetical protein
MSGARAQFVVALLAAAVCLTAAKPAGGSERHLAQKQPFKAEPQPAPQAPPQPLVPLTLEGLPAMPPEVSYRDGQLTIVAQNSTLADILRAVRAQTHASVDVPPSATERVVSRFGPGPAREVMAELLNGSHFNYVLLGSAADPAALDRVILTPKAPSAAATTSEVPVSSPQPSALSGAGSSEATNQQANPSASDLQSGDPADHPADDPPPGNPPPVRTPEQMLQREQWKAGRLDRAPTPAPPQTTSPSQ